MMRILEVISNQDEEMAERERLPEPEVSPYQVDRIETGRGTLPAVIRYMPHAIILWGVGYVLVQAESNLINYITAVLLVLWSGYNLLAVKKKWPLFP